MDWVYIVLAFLGGVLVTLLVVYFAAKYYGRIMGAIEKLGRSPPI